MATNSRIANAVHNIKMVERLRVRPVLRLERDRASPKNRKEATEAALIRMFKHFWDRI